MKEKKKAYLAWMQKETSEAKEEYLQAKREAKRAVRRAQNEEWIELGRSLQDDFQRNQRRFWKRVTKKSEREEASKVCDENGEVIDEEERVLDRWKEYFGGLLDGGVQSKEECSRQDTESWLEEGIGIEEVIAVIAKLKNGKAPGICGISAEMLKAGGSAVAKWLHRIINLMWTTGEVPADWTKAVIVPIHKKGSKMICSNYRGISLLSIPCKVYTRKLDGRVRSITESKVMEVQGGFRRGRSCVDQVFTIRQLSEKVLEKNGQMAVACADLEKAYDNVCREKLWRLLDEYGVKGNLMKAIRSLYTGSQACARVGGRLSEWFPISQGVRQGCVLSPWLFNVFMDRI